MDIPLSHEPLTQIHIGRGPNGFEAVSSVQAHKDFYKWENETMKAQLMRLCAPRLWPHGSYNNSCPRPILTNVQHQLLLRELHNALVASVTDIVNRWWFDKAAGFPKRMPLGKKEEELLKYVELQSTVGILPHYATRKGSWRPDFLVEEMECVDGTTIENFRITEINARFCFNAFMHATYGHTALDDTGMERHGLVSATTPKEVVDGLFTLFRRDVPLHLLKGEEPGIDFNMFADAVGRRTGYVPRVVNPADLRIVTNEKSKTGYTLCALYKGPELGVAPPSPSSVFLTSDDELVEEIHQVGLELHQRELFALQPEILREISMRCFNDMRTILLVHDKRMLGIIKQELKKQVAREVITQRQAELLDRGIADTFLPGSSDLRQLLLRSEQCPLVRQDFLLKPIRSGKGDGIVFGDELTNEEWVAALERQLSPELELERSCVVQRRVISRLYDVVLKSSGEKLRYPLIGTYLVTNGVFLGLAGWRSSGDRICTVGNGGAWICSVVRKEDTF
ncbi:hypothetical protein ACHAQJ_005332 [Trichoderma viride]